MNEIEAALDRIDDYIESIENGSENPPDPETETSILSFAYAYMMAKQIRKVDPDAEIDEAGLYRKAEEYVKEGIKHKER